MTPFSEILHELRMRYRVRQVDLAETLGYEQSYLSALESDAKGPPTQEFLDRLASALDLEQADRIRLADAADASSRKFAISNELPTDTYWMLSELRRDLPSLSPEQVQLIRGILKLRSSANEPTLHPLPRRLKRRRNKEATM